jgi:hypothetical protein
MTSPLEAIPLPNRGAVRVSGDDRVAFLQGLVSNDVRRVGPSRAIHAALLTPQGKYLHDFFIVDAGDALVLDCEAARADDLASRLSRFRLRAKVAVAAVAPPPVIAAIIGGEGMHALGLGGQPAGTARAFAGGVAFVDPRLGEAGARVMLPAAGAAAALADAGFGLGQPHTYERHRLALGLPDGSRDMEVEKAILLECGFEELAGVDWEKGCYMGQELTARTRYRGLIKKRLVPVEVAAGAELPPPGTPVCKGEREVGDLRSGLDGRALALLRLEALAGGDDPALHAAGVRLRVAPPAWLKLS